MIISPGFIDVHTHIEGDEIKTPTADNFIFDGVTTVVTGIAALLMLISKTIFKKLIPSNSPST
jgi:N-acyl-D-amino-acid deacylase